MRSARWRTAVAVGVDASFLLAACGSDSKSSDTTAAPTTAGAATTAAGATTTAGGAATTAKAATTTAAKPAASTAGSTASTAGAGSGAEQVDPGSKSPPPSGVGLIDGVYKGTSGFEIDPSRCPADWDPKQGITDTEINLFISLPTSGPLAGFGLLADGAKAYFKYINDERRHRRPQDQSSTSKDDAYKPDQTKTNVDEAMRLEEVRRAVRHARHAEQPRRLGRDQRRVHAAAAQRHRRGAVG